MSTQQLRDSSRELRWITFGSLTAQGILLAVMVYGKRLVALLFLLGLLLWPYQALAECRIVIIDGKTCQMCDHMTICP